MKKLFIKILIIFVVVFTGLYFLTKHLENRFINNNNNKSTWIINRSGDTVDYAFLGSSKVYNIVDIKTLVDSSNIKAINLGTAGSSYIDNYIILKKYIEKNKIKNLILEADYMTIVDPKIQFSYPFHDFLFIPFMDKDNDIDEIIKENSKPFDYYTWKYIPTSRYLEFNNIYLKPEYFMQYKFNPSFDNFGTELLNQNSTSFYKIITEKDLLPDSTTIANINRIINLCKENAINVIIISVPHYFEVYKLYNLDMVRNILPELAKKNNLRYINFEGDELENKKELFYDYNHLNKEGAILFTNQLKDSLTIN